MSDPDASGDGPPSGAGRAETERTGLEIAREALAAAKAEAKRRGSSRGDGPGRPAKRSASERRSSARPDDRDPQPLGGSIERLVSERGWEIDVAVGGVLGRWDELVGAELAAHCRPDTFADGELVVRTETSAWATQVRWMAPKILARLNDELGPGTVTRLKVTGPERPSWRKGSISVRGRGPRDTYG